MISLLIGCIIAFSLGEIIIRGVYFFQSQKAPVDRFEADEKLGWTAKRNMKFSGQVADAKEVPYPLEVTSNQNGFRFFGNIDSSRKKILFIGDSFTHAVEVSDDVHYAKILADSLNFEPFIYGCGGWGTLQELLFLKEWFRVIEPDIVVLQFCTNDIINNFYELEANSFFNNSRMERPYLNANGGIDYLHPGRFELAGIKKWSKLIPFFVTRLERMRDHRLQKNKQSSEHLMAEHGKGYAPFNEAIHTTEHLIQKVANLTNGKSELLIFSVDHFQPCSDAIDTICSSNNIQFEDTVPYYIALEKQAGRSVFAADGAHWNNAGHRVAAQTLSAKISSLLDFRRVD